MRVTKVKVNNKDVKMERNDWQGYLVHGEKPNHLSYSSEANIRELIKKKQASFNLSLKNQTLIKRPLSANQAVKRCKTCKKHGKFNSNKSSDYCNDCKQVALIEDNFPIIDKIFEEIINEKPGENLDVTSLKGLDETDIRKYLNHRFQKPTTYYLSKDDKEKGQKTTFDLASLLKKTFNQGKNMEGIRLSLQQYQTWIIWKRAHWQKSLAKSIYHNKIITTTSPHSRKQNTLKQLAQQFCLGTMNTEMLGCTFHLNALVQRWQNILKGVEKYTDNDLKEKKCEEESLGIPIEYFEFKRALKKALIQHQSECYKNQLFGDDHVQLYSNFVSEYLALYFPLKKSGKKLSGEDIDYYLKESTISTRLQKHITNNVLQYLLRLGKQKYYNIEDNTCSLDLQKIQIQETFALQFIDACAFASSNLRNIVDPSFKSDILGMSDLQSLLNGPFRPYSLHHLANFFAYPFFDFENTIVTTNHKKIVAHLKKDINHYLTLISAIRSAITGIRNNIMHFKKEPHKEFLKLEQYEQIQCINDNFKVTSARFCELTEICDWFQDEVDRLSNQFAEKLRSSSIIDYYALKDITGCLKSFHLNTKPLAFIPGFKKVYTWGVKYQFENINYLKLSHYFKKEITITKRTQEVKREDEARYNLLALIYEQSFMSAFFNDHEPDLFKKAVNAVLKSNEQRARNSNFLERQAFKEVPPFDPQNSIADYLTSLQSTLMIEENKKRKEGKLKANETGNYQQFIWQLFAKGFDCYLDLHPEYGFANSPRYQFNDDTKKLKADQQNRRIETLQETITVETTIKPKDNSHIAFWLFCKLLDAKHLNELHNQLSKWRQAQSSLMASTDLTDLQTLQEIINLCLLNTDITSNSWSDYYKDIPRYFETLSRFINMDSNVLKLQTDIYAQSDHTTPIILSHIELTNKYATLGVITKLINNHPSFKVSKEELNEWKKISRDNNADNPAHLSLKRQQLHQHWVNEEDKRNWLITKFKDDPKQINGEYYQQLCEKLDKYNWLSNKIHLVHIRHLHHLLIDILGRLAGYINLWERDWRFLHEAYFKSDGIQTPYFAFNEELNIQNADSKYKEFLYSCFLSKVNTRINDNPVDNKGSWKDKRNFIAHFNYLTKFDSKGNLHPLTNSEMNKKDLYHNSILELLNYVIELVSYDRKLKNAVAKSFIDLLDKHGIEIKFKPLHGTRHQFQIKDGYPCSKKITHLKGARIKIGDKYQSIQSHQVHPDYVAMVKALLELKI